MLGFALPGSPLRYSLTWTIISALLAVIAVFAALYLLVTEFSWARLLTSGFLVGTGITVMHYTGMQALQFQGQINYNTLFIALSFVIAVPIVAIMTVRDREIARMDATSDDLAHEAREFVDR